MTTNGAYEPPPATGRGPQTSEEARIRVLESQVQALAEAVRAMSRSLEQPPSRDAPLPVEVARGARLAHEILLSQGL